jgi:hypothetical protein
MGSAVMVAASMMPIKLTKSLVTDNKQLTRQNMQLNLKRFWFGVCAYIYTMFSFY